MLLNVWPPPQLEIELKFLLDPEGYRKLLEKMEKQVLGQDTFTTYYLDTKKGHLKTAGFNLRIRLGKEFATMTLKFATVIDWDGESSPKMRWELEDEVDFKKATAVVEGRQTIHCLNNRGTQVLQGNVAASKLDNLRTIGQLDISRTQIQWSEGVVLEVDRYQISGETIFEIEIEIKSKDPDTVYRSVTSKLDEWKISWSESTTSKRSRLMSSLGRK